jgi:hypothetical protein
MMPTELVLRAVAVRANPITQLAGLVDQLFSRHRGQVFVHDVLNVKSPGQDSRDI